MKKIGVLSDTHTYFDPRLYDFFANVDEIWHAGDFGSAEVFDEIEKFKPIRAVFGNVDGAILRIRLKEVERFECEGVNVLLTHIGGYPGNYDPAIRSQIYSNPPNLFICGHSHILKIMNDKELNLLHVNPGAAGKSGIHTVQTAVRFVIDEGTIKDMEVGEFKMNQ
ncbi:MAG: metallophosphatase family protein [Marinilabiliaceae bacterium]|nr:metallophosphatase family protein [Marinilabiliaceae bacterium]